MWLRRGQSSRGKGRSTPRWHRLRAAQGEELPEAGIAQAGWEEGGKNSDSAGIREFGVLFSGSLVFLISSGTGIVACGMIDSSLPWVSLSWSIQSSHSASVSPSGLRNPRAKGDCEPLRADPVHCNKLLGESAVGQTLNTPWRIHGELGSPAPMEDLDYEERESCNGLLGGVSSCVLEKYRKSVGETPKSAPRGRGRL